MIDLHNGVKATNATRETRIEVVAWIAVCKIHCELEGGFVRDWIVGDYVSRAAGIVHKELILPDLDCHLPVRKYFGIDRFTDELYKLNIECEFIREDRRYVLLLDKNAPTGPFSRHLIEPHVPVTQYSIDCD
ncbi:unnamed protein product, partial [Rotaria sp. Silwood2]